MITILDTNLFWNNIGNFNSRFQTLHYCWIAVSIVLILIVFLKPNRLYNNILKLFLGVSFLFNGTVFFCFLHSHPLGRFFYGPLFILIGLLFIIDIFKGTLIIKFPTGKLLRSITCGGLILFYIYPLLGMLLGRSFPHLCMPMNACPLTVMAILLSAAAWPALNRTILFLLIPWGILGLPKALGMYGCYEDVILFLAGVYAIAILVLYRKKQKRE